MNSKKSTQIKNKKKGNRTGNKGNILWKCYKELGETPLSEFKALLSYNGIPLTTFYADTYLEKDLGSIPVGRMYVYRAYFKNIDLDALIPVKRPDSTNEGATA